jgi:MYXO-CTERM domain-containing protein
LGGLPDDSDDDPSDDGRSLFADATAPEEAPCMCTLPGAQTTGDAGAMAATVLVALGLLRRRRLREPQTTTGHL